MVLVLVYLNIILYTNDIADVNDSREFTNEPNNDVYTSDLLLDNEYYVWAEDENDARRKLKRHMDLNRDGTTLVNINLTTPVISVDQNDVTNVCKPNYRCTIGDISFEVDATNQYCLSAFDEQLDAYNCDIYHTITNCIQNCTFVNENNNLEKTLEKDGFQKMHQLVDVNYRVTDSMEMVEESMEPNFKTFYTTFIKGEPDVYSDNGFLYSEYVFQMFLENIYPGSKLHKLTDGLYFINGKFIICRIAKGNLRISNIRTTIWDNLTSEQQEAATTLGWTEFFWNNQHFVDDGILFIQTPNWDNLTPKQKDAATTLGWTSETWGKNVPYSKFYNTSSSPFPLLHMDFQKYITNDNIGNIYTDNTNERLQNY